MRPTTNRLSAGALTLLLLAGCSRPPAVAAHDDHHPAAPTNRIEVPEAVRKNLGIEFVHVERRRVASTRRLPGHFELQPQAQHELRAPLAGRIELRVQPLQVVAPGDVLYILDSPAWRDLQRQLGELESDVALAASSTRAVRPLLDAHHAHEESLEEALTVMQDRIRSLEATAEHVGGQAQSLADARVLAAQTRAQIAEAEEQHAETAVRLATLEAEQRRATERRRLLLAGAAATIGVAVAELDRDDGKTGWRALDVLTVRATSSGVVDRLPIASGGWAEAHELVLRTIVPEQVRFRAQALQSDLAELADGLPSRLLPAGRAVDASMAIAATLQLGTEANAQQRTIDVFATPTGPANFARAGVAAFLEVETTRAARPELCVPMSALMPDGTARVFFRRDPDHADKVLRIDADLGLDDGRWIEIKSGIVDGDEVVLAGAYELMLASSGSAPKGGHFHADGSFHEGEDK